MKKNNEKNTDWKTDLENFGPFTYVLNSISKNRWRTGLTIIGIAVPIAFFVLFAAMGEGLDQYIDDKSEDQQINKQQFIKMSEIVNSWTNVLMAIIAIMIISSIANTILMSTSERKFEFGILSAIGINRVQIMYLVVIEAFLISFIALIIGVIIGFWGAIIFDYMFWLDEGAGFFFAPARINFNSIVTVAFLTLTVGILTAIYPALYASRSKTIEILRCE